MNVMVIDDVDKFLAAYLDLLVLSNMGHVIVAMSIFPLRRSLLQVGALLRLTMEAEGKMSMS